jgi:ubiquinone biosynthesis monooxygenase Coq7
MPKPDFTDQYNKIAEIIRVNHAGEYGAKRIYEAQFKFTKNKETKILIKEMLDSEQVHLDYFNRQLIERKIRPTIFTPLWHIGGYMLGATSALIGSKTAMLVTEKVEEVIAEHYQEQIKYLEGQDQLELLSHIKQFQAEEMTHQQIAIKNNSQGSICPLLFGVIIKNICKVAISISKRL